MLDTLSHEEKMNFCLIIANLIKADGFIAKQEESYLKVLTQFLNLDLDKEVGEKIRKELEANNDIKQYVEKISDKKGKIMLFKTMIYAAYADNEMLAIEREKIIEAAKIMELDINICERVLDVNEEIKKLEKTLNRSYEDLIKKL